MKWRAPWWRRIYLWLCWSAPVRRIRNARTWRRYRRTGDCGYGCDFVKPYGFVPEAECPVHDH